MPAQVSPDTLYLIEGGGGQGGPFTAMCWGDGFITNRCARSRRQFAAAGYIHCSYIHQEMHFRSDRTIVQGCLPTDPTSEMQCDATRAPLLGSDPQVSVALRRTIISQYGLYDPNPFFESLSTKPYLNNVVISPHYYPPSVSQQNVKCAKPASPV